MSVTIPIITGMRLVHIPTDTEFTVLCSCPRSKPRHYTRRFVETNRQDYRLPNTENQDAIRNV